MHRRNRLMPVGRQFSSTPAAVGVNIKNKKAKSGVFVQIFKACDDKKILREIKIVITVKLKKKLKNLLSSYN